MGSIVLMLSESAITKTLLWERLQADGKRMAVSSNRLRPKHLKKRIRALQGALEARLLHIGFSWITIFKRLVQGSYFVCQPVEFFHVQRRQRFHQSLGSGDALEGCLDAFLTDPASTRRL